MTNKIVWQFSQLFISGGLLPVYILSGIYQSSVCGILRLYTVIE
jgi:hypothetical protein